MARLFLAPAPCTVRKAEGRSGWVVEGEIAVIGGRQVNEPFRTFRPTKGKAEAEAARQDRINTDAIEALIAETEAERIAAEARRATRAAAAATKAEKLGRHFSFGF